MCVRSGLTSAKDLTTATQQREALLTMALEHNMVGVIVAAARDWADGRFSTAGCTLKFLLDWAWRRVASIKERLDVASVPLFDCSVPEVDDKCRQLLTQLSSQLANLCTVLAAVTSGAGFITQLGMEELECRQNVTGLVLLYTQAIHWFVSVGLLPEQIDSQASPFPAKQLLAQYREKRRQLAALPASYGQPGLLVDILCKDIGDELRSAFERGGGPGSYPPPSLQALLSTFLADCPAPAKLRLVQYFFLDLAHLLPPDTWPDLVDSLIKFPSAFSLPPSVIKLTQAFWLLDHEDWDEAVAMMLDPLIQEDDLTSAHHRAILIVLLTQKQHSLALRYTRLRRPPVTDPSDVELHTAVLLANGAIQEAFTFQRSRRGATTFNSIMLQFFRRAEELGKLDAVLQLSLSTQEEREFVSFLQQTDRADSREVLLMYYLQRSRFTEAMQLNEQLKGVIGGGARSAAREAIMERYNHILPGLAKSFGTRKVCLTGASSFNQRPVPMSVTIKDRHFSLNSHASLIEQQLSNKPASPTPATPFRQKNKRGMIGLLSESVVSPQVKRKFTESTLCFPSENIVDSSGLDTPDMSVTNDLVSPPSKRTRLGDVTSLSMSVTSIRRLSRFMTAEALTILSTPNVTRKSIRRMSSPPRPVPSTTPQSILKVKRLMKDALEESPLAQEGNIGNILNVTDRNVSRLTRSRESTPAKSLRVSFSSGKGVKIAPTASPAVAELSGGAVSTPVIEEEEEAIEAPSTNDVSKVSSKSSASGGRDDSFHSLDETMESDMEVDSPPPHVNFSWVSKDAPPWVDTPESVLTAPSKVLSVESPEKVPMDESPEKVPMDESPEKVPMDESPERVPVVDSPEKVVTAPSKVLTAANAPEFDTLHLRNRVVTETLTPRNEGWQKDQVPPHSTPSSTASQGRQKCEVAPDSTPTAAAFQSSSGAEFDTLHLRNRVVTESFTRVNPGWSTEDTLSPASRAEIEQVIRSAEEKIRRKEDEVREKIVSSTAANVDEEEVEAPNTDEVDEANKEITSQTKDGSDEGVILLSDTEDADENSDSESEEGSDAEENAGEEEDDEEGDSQGEDEDDEEDQASDEDEAKLDFSWAPEGSFKKAFEGESVEAIQKLVAEEVEELEMKNSDQNATGDTEDLDYSPDEAYHDKNEQVEESVVISDDDDDENKTGNLPSYIGFDTEIENTSVKQEEAELSEVRDENEDNDEDNDEQSDENQEIQSEDESEDENAEVKESENEVVNKLDEETQEPASSEEDVWTTEPFKFDSYLDDEVIEVDDDDEEEPETIDEEHDDTYRSKEDEMKLQGVNVNEEESNEEKIEKVADSEECQIDISKSASNITTEEQEMSCTDTTDDMDIKVNIEIDETSTDDVGGKTGDVMRELLFKKEATTLDGSIVATRASSIAGSVISDLPGLDSASMDPKFDFADIEPIKGDVGETDIDKIPFDFSKPESMDPTDPEDLKGAVSLNDEDPPIGQADQMRDLLDKVCSSNTRASSVCGTKASSTGGLSVSSGFQPTFSFSDVEVVDRVDRDVGEGPEFDFSKPGCNSTETAVETEEKQGMDISENNEDGDDDEWEDMDEDEDENKDGDEDESIDVESGYEDKDEESEDASEEETDGEEAPGLDFSWTKIGTSLEATAEQTIADIVKEEMEQDMSYDFAKPENTSMESVEDLEKVPSYQFTKPSDPQDDVDMEVEIPEEVQNFNGEDVIERSTSEQSSGVLESADTISKEVDQQDVNIKPTQIETELTNIAGITKLKSATSEAKSTPKKAQSTPSKAGVSASIIKSTPSKEHSTSSKTQQIPSKTSSTPSKPKSTPSKIMATPTRRSRRLSSASTDNSPQSPSTRQTPRRATSKTQMEEVSTSSLAMDVIPEIPEEKELTPKRGNKVASEPVKEYDTLHLRNRVVIETLSPKAEGWNQGSKLDDSKAVDSPVESLARKGSGRLAKNNESVTPLKEETTEKQNVTPRRMPKRGAISEVSPNEENISKKTDTQKTLEELAGKTSNQTSGSKEGPGVIKQVLEDAKINKDSGVTPKRTPRRGAKKDIPEEILPISEHIISPKRTPRRGAQKEETDEHFITPKRTPRRGVVKGGPEETEVQKVQMQPSTPKRTPKRGGAIESTEKVGSTSKLSAIPEKVDISEPQVTPKKAASSSNVSDESKATLRKATTPRNTPKRGAANLADIPEEPKIAEQPFEDEKNTASHVTSKTQTPQSSSNILVSTGRNRRRRHSETTAEATDPSPQVNTEPKTTKGRGRPRRNSEAAVEIQTPEPSPLVKTEVPSTKGRGRLRRNSETAMDVSGPEPSPQASTEAQTTTGRGRLRRNSETAATEVSTSVGARTRRRSSITPTTTPLATTESSPITKSSVSARKTKNQSPLKAEAPISGRKAKMLSPRKIVLMKNALKETLQENKSLEPEKEKGVQNSSEEDMEVDNLAGVSSSKLGTPSGRSTRRRDRSSPDITLSPGVDRKEELFPGSPGEVVAQQIDEKNKSLEIGKTEDKSNTSLGKDKVEETVIPQRETRRKSTPLKQSIEGTPTRRSRRVSGEGLSSERVVDTAPDGGIIAGRTPRKVTPSKARRHTSVKPADVEKALALEPVLETPEEEEAEDVEMKAETDAQPERKRRGSSIQKPDANLQVIEEESETSKTTPDSSEVKRSTRKTKSEVPEQSSESSPSSSPSNSPAKNDEASTSQASTSPMAGSSRPALRSASETEVVTSRSTRRQSRRHTITTLETDVDLFTPPPAKSSGRMSMGAGTEADKKKKKYVVSKKKTSVRIQ